LLQRWLSPDPLELHVGGSGDLNLYAYVSGQALKMTDPLGLCGNGAGGGAQQCGGAEGQAGSEVQQVNSEPLETSAVGDLAMAAVCTGTAMLVCGGASVTGDQPLREDEIGSTKVNEMFASATLASGAGQATSGAVRTVANSAPVKAAAKSLSQQLDDMVSGVKAALNVGDDVAAATERGIGASEATRKMTPRVVQSDAAKGAAKAAEQGWELGGFKSAAKWESQMAKRGWAPEQITEALQQGERFAAENLVNKGNAATRYVHPGTGRSVVVDDVTKELIHVGGDGFKY
jgi:hypothetical protein